MATGTPNSFASPMVSSQNRGPIVISVDAMGGDRGPATVVAGLVLAMREHSDLHVILHGDEAQIAPLLAREPSLKGRVTLRHAERIVTMEDKPSQVMRHGQGTSMWHAIDSVKDGAATVAVSCGNTGALMAVSMLRLRKLPGVNRPAIACFWPSRSEAGWSVMLDVGADIKADAGDLVQYAIMGAAYASDALSLALPKVGLMNVGTEENKGRPELKEAHELLTQAAGPAAGFQYAGFIEGSDLPSAHVNVIVMDGFTGNVALKTGEGTAKLVGDFLREAFSAGILSRFAALLALNSLKRLRKRIDPRRVNGGVFLGLNGAVVKSHGSADATGVNAALGLAYRLAHNDFTRRLAARVASAAAAGQDAAAMGAAEQAGAGSDPAR
jgi:glycerol-3-phosphate acyltransferase PlsX